MGDGKIAHIPDGVLSLPVIVAGGAASAGMIALSLKQLQPEDVPKTAVLAAVFFLCSLVTVPVGPTTVHPVLNGLMGIILGWAAVSAIAVALLLQMVFLGFGGPTAYGVNLTNAALPALLCAIALRPLLLRARTPGRAGLVGAIAGIGAVLATSLLIALALALSDPAYLTASKLVVATHVPLMVAEAAIGAAVVSFLWRVSPDMIGAVH